MNKTTKTIKGTFKKDLYNAVMALYDVMYGIEHQPELCISASAKKVAYNIESDSDEKHIMNHLNIIKSTIIFKHYHGSKFSENICNIIYKHYVKYICKQVCKLLKTKGFHCKKIELIFKRNVKIPATDDNIKTIIENVMTGIEVANSYYSYIIAEAVITYY